MYNAPWTATFPVDGAVDGEPVGSRSQIAWTVVREEGDEVRLGLETLNQAVENEVEGSYLFRADGPELA